MATCRVYLCTYRRAQLLARAVESLLKQTRRDWVCEVHNDDPDDDGPRRLVEALGDPRVVVVDHERNLGPTRTFNLVFAGAEEPYLALLEDDNWWEPTFLERMLTEMSAHPEIAVGWANMRIWEEQKDGSWRNTGRDIWESGAGPVELFEFPHPRHIGGALHSNGAMLVRSSVATRYTIPDATTFAAVEPVRERCFDYPLLFVREPLANFAVTRTTARDRDVSTWIHIQVLLASTFFRHVPLQPATVEEIWAEARRGTPTTNTLLLCALTRPDCRHLLRYARPVDLLRLARTFVGRPATMARTLRRLGREGAVEEFLDRHTAERVRVARARGFGAL